MALKPLRSEDTTRVYAFCNEVADRGRIMTWEFATVSGLGDMDDAGSRVRVATGAAGLGATDAPAGMLMNDVVNRDLSRDRLNWHQDEVQLGSKVCLMTRGMAKTNCLVANLNPIPGSGAWYTVSGELTMTPPGNPIAQVGRFVSAKDSDGYALVEINLP